VAHRYSAARAAAALLAVTALALGAAAQARASTATQCLPAAPTSALDPGAFTALWSAAGPGWTGGDGARSLPLPDGRVLWTFGDTFLGAVAPDGTRPLDAPIVRNSVVVQEGPCLTTHFGGTPEAPEDFLPPPDPAHWQWPGDPIVHDDTVQFVAGEFREGVWFEHVRDWVVTLALPSLEVVAQIPLDERADVIWGESMLPDGEWTYVYGIGTTSPKGLYVARARPDDLNIPSQWRFFTGSGWSAKAAAAQPALTGVASADVMAVDGGYLVLSQHEALFATLEVYAHLAPTPAGPWGPELRVATIPEPGAGLFTYGANAHHQFDVGRKVLIGYSVNSFDELGAYQHASVYRPRFLSSTLPRVGRVLTIGARRLRVGASGTVTLPVTCKLAWASCAGTIELLPRASGRRLAAAPIALEPGATATVTLRLSRSARGALRPGRWVPGRVRARLLGPGATPFGVEAAVELLRG
jgi:hypothetical protein